MGYRTKTHWSIRDFFILSDVLSLNKSIVQVNPSIVFIIKVSFNLKVIVMVAHLKNEMVNLTLLDVFPRIFNLDCFAQTQLFCFLFLLVIFKNFLCRPSVNGFSFLVTIDWILTEPSFYVGILVIRTRARIGVLTAVTVIPFLCWVNRKCVSTVIYYQVILT